MEAFDLDLLLSVAGGLGRWQDYGSKRLYMKDDDAVACLRDVQRFLRRDDPRDRPAFMKLGELQTVENDVIPLITTFPTDTDLVYNALKVMTFMTMPIDLAIISDLLPKQLCMLSSMKESCLNRDLLGALMALAAGPISRADRMSDEDHQVLQLLLTFFRNLVCIPDRPLSGSAMEKGHRAAQDKLLVLLFDESVMELALLVAGQVDERRFKEDAPLLLDLLAAVYDGVAVSDVLGASQAAVAAAEEAQARREAVAARAAAARNKKTIAQQILASKTATTRSGRFKTTLVVSHPDTAATTIIRDLKQKHTLAPLGWDIETRVLPPPSRCLSPALLLTFKTFTNTLLQGAYNVLMSSVLVEMSKGHGFSTLLQEGDATKWFDLAAWFTGYVRLHQEQLSEQKRKAKDQQQPPAGPAGANAADTATSAGAAAAAGGADDAHVGGSVFGCVSASLCYEAFRQAHARFMDQVDMSPRSQFKDWPLLHAATLFLREGLGCLELGTRSGATADRRAAEQLARQLLYDGSREEGLLPAFARRIKKFSAKHEPRSTAAVLAEAVHALLRLYDRLSARDGGVFRMKKAVVRVQQQQQRKQTPPADQQPDEQQEGLEHKDQPAAAAGTQPDAAEADKRQTDGHTDSAAAAPAADGGAAQQQPIGDSPQQQQQQQTAKRSASPAASQQPPAQHSRGGTPAAAAAGGGGGGRSPTPAGGQGSRAASPAVAADGPTDSAGQQQRQQHQQQQQKVRPVLEELEEEEGEYSGSEEEREVTRVHEVVLDLNRELRTHYGAPSVVHFYSWLLAGVTAGVNSPALTHAVVSFLWRIVLPEHLGLEPLMYQLSVLRLFHQLLADPALRKQPENKEVLLLATKVVRGLFAKLAPPHPQQQEQQEQQQGADEEADTGADAAASKAAAEAREGRRRAAVSGMLCVELLFWKHPHTCDQIGREYSLGEDDRYDAPVGRKSGKGAGGEGRSGRGQAPLLSAAGEEQLKRKFEALCGNRSSFDTLLAQMGGRLKAIDIRREMRRLGLKFGVLPASLQPQLLELFRSHEESVAAQRGDRMAITNVTQDVAEKLPGGWSEKQVKKLLQTEGLLPGGAAARRKTAGVSSSDDDDDDDAEAGWGSGDVLLGVPLPTLEALYQKYLTEPDYLDKIAAELDPAVVGGSPATAADVKATLQHHGLLAAKAPKPRKGAGGDGSGGRGGSAAAARRVSKALLAGLWADHGGSADGLNLIAMALGLPVKEVQKLLIKHNINTSHAPGSDDGSGSGSSDGGSDDEGGGAAARRRRRRAAAAAGGGPGPRMPVSADRLRQLYKQHCTQQQQQQQQDGDEQQQMELLEAIAQELPVPASSSQVLLWLQHAGIVAGGGSSRRVGSGAAAAGGTKRLRKVGRQGDTMADAMEELDNLLDDFIGDDNPFGTQKEGRKKASLAAAAAAAAAAGDGGGSGGSALRRVPEPQPVLLLGFLQAMQQAHDESGRWLGAHGAVSWLLGKLDAAESVWAAAAQVAASVGGCFAAADYALVPSGEADLDFFCSEYSNEVLEAAGVRNDDDDFFKIPGSSTPSWRARVRVALKEAVSKLGGVEAAAACEEVLKDAAAAAAAAAAGDAAAAAEEQRLLEGGTLVGFSGGKKQQQQQQQQQQQKGGDKGAGSKRKGRRGQQQQPEEGEEERGGKRPSKRQKKTAAAAAAALAAGAGAAGRRGGKGMKAAVPQSSDGSSSDSETAADDGGSDHDLQGSGMEDSSPQQQQQQRRKGPAGGRGRKRSSAAAAAGSGGGSSDSDGGAAGQKLRRKKGRPSADDDHDSDDDEQQQQLEDSMDADAGAEADNSSSSSSDDDSEGEVGTHGDKQRQRQQQQQRRRQHRRVVELGGSMGGSGSLLQGSEEFGAAAAVQESEEFGAKGSAAAAAAGAGVIQESEEFGVAAARQRSALGEITALQQQQQQGAKGRTPPLQAKQQQQQFNGGVVVMDDDLEDSGDENTAAAAAAAAGARKGGAAVARPRARTVISDDDDD